MCILLRLHKGKKWELINNTSMQSCEERLESKNLYYLYFSDSYYLTFNGLLISFLNIGG